MLYAIFLIIAGFILLMGGAEYLVKGAVDIAAKLKIPTIIVGLTIVAFGTSTPEFVVSIKAALNGSAGISVGNVIGSNIANILLILGITALISPIKCRRRIFLRDYKFLFAVSLLFSLFTLNGRIDTWQGIVFLLLLLGFIYHNYKNSSQEDIDDGEEKDGESSWLKVIFITLGGLLAILFGADILVKGAVNMARILGVSEEIIGLTIIAVGTSLPELATTVLATLRRQTGVALGNIVGSNIWNIVFIMGATSTITEVNVPKQFIYYDVWVMLVSTLVLYPAMMTKARLTRLEGFLFFIVYVAYIISQILISKGIWVLA